MIKNIRNLYWYLFRKAPSQVGNYITERIDGRKNLTQEYVHRKFLKEIDMYEKILKRTYKEIELSFYVGGILPQFIGHNVSKVRNIGWKITGSKKW